MCQYYLNKRSRTIYIKCENLWSFSIQLINLMPKNKVPHALM
ncbi:hypothetical protein SLEP1_g33511 [Rubroshorea leprosula]|uniref:Uncharacterized protein n=1 Tax=Rubroshorea leprosula TaxID=152421 RepID=A0AAV5KGW8_9ROSI|nr:hypothetical protein SLEP1_g33511 [Rubroshorea leprosula]